MNERSQRDLFMTSIYEVRARKVRLWLLFIAGCLLHILFTSQGIFYPWNWEYGLTVLLVMTGSGMVGVLFSVAFLAFPYHYAHPKPRPELPTMQMVNWSIYIGYGIRTIMWMYESRPHGPMT